MPRPRWRFYDPTEDEEIILPINPREGALPAFERAFTGMPLADPAAQPVIFEGAGEPKKLTFAGYIGTEAHYRIMRRWVEGMEPFRITDDLGNVFWGVLRTFVPARKNRVRSPWAQDYTCEFWITDLGTL